MEEKDLFEAPTKIMLFTWLNSLMKNDNAEINKENNMIIDLSPYASSWFSVGRELENKNGFIGVSKTLIPWFVDLKWDSAVISFEKGRLYLTCGSENDEGLTISFKVRKKRLNLIYDEATHGGKDSTLDFRMFSIKADGGIFLSKLVLKQIPIRISDNISDVVYNDTTVNVDLEMEYEEQISMKFKELYASKYMEIDDDLGEEDEW